MNARIGPCQEGHAWHVFDPVSGWCNRACGWRDDGARTYPAKPLPELDVPDVTEPRRSTSV